ncbi:MAG: SUF system NifU family Fe-S cluster assembly protein [Bacteroidia bacterium]
MSHSLYHPTILHHNDHPVRYEKMPDADRVVEAYNQFCGDQFFLYIKFEGEVIADASFHGYGCALSKASASLLVSLLPGMDKRTFEKLHQPFQALVSPEANFPQPTDLPEPLFVFQAARDFPARKKCVLLTWDELSRQWK